MTRNSDVNLFYLIYIYIFFSFTSGSTFFCRSSSSSALLFTFLLICSMKKFWLELTYLRTIMWHLFYFLILIYFSVLTTVGKSQRQIIIVSQWSTVLYVVLIWILRAALTIFKFIFLWKNFQCVNSCFKSLCLSYLHSWKIC